MQRSGFADLPLHGGRVPQWLAERMTRLGTAIAEIIICDYGASAFLSRLSDPFWFQAFGSVMGMDWHSSLVRTSRLTARIDNNAIADGFQICRHYAALKFVRKRSTD